MNILQRFSASSSSKLPHGTIKQVRFADLQDINPPSTSLPPDATESTHAPQTRRIRAINVLRQFEETQRPPSHGVSRTRGITAIHRRMRPIDLLSRFPEADAPATTRKRLRAIDLVSQFPSHATNQSPASTSRLTIRLPARARSAARTPVSVAPENRDIRMDPPDSPPALGIEFDAEMQDIRHAPPTTDPIEDVEWVDPRRTSQHWAGTYLPEHFVVSREELQADEAHREQGLPAVIEEGSYPAFVSSLFSFHSTFTYNVNRRSHPRMSPLCIDISWLDSMWTTTRATYTFWPCTGTQMLSTP